MLGAPRIGLPRPADNAVTTGDICFVEEVQKVPFVFEIQSTVAKSIIRDAVIVHDIPRAGWKKHLMSSGYWWLRMPR